ncbi:MAG: hypothetical protein ACJ71Q_12000 [Terriglobales bacterium]
MRQATTDTALNPTVLESLALFRRGGEEASQISDRRQVSQPFSDWGIQSEMMLQIRVVKRPPLTSAARLELHASFAEPVLVHPAGLADGGF